MNNTIKDALLMARAAVCQNKKRYVANQDRKGIQAANEMLRHIDTKLDLMGCSVMK